MCIFAKSKGILIFRTLPARRKKKERKGNSLYQMRTQWRSGNLCDILLTSLYVCATSTV